MRRSYKRQRSQTILSLVSGGTVADRAAATPDSQSTLVTFDLTNSRRSIHLRSSAKEGRARLSTVLARIRMGRPNAQQPTIGRPARSVLVRTRVGVAPCRW